MHPSCTRLRQVDADQIRSALVILRKPAAADHGCNDWVAPMLRSILLQTSVIMLLVPLACPGFAASPAEQRGKTFAVTNCSKCHSVDRVTQSPLKIAPPFRDLHLRYPVEGLAEALAEGIETGHPTMPRFQLDPDQIHDLLSYLKSLE